MVRRKYLNDELISNEPMHPIFDHSEIKDVFITPDIRYLEFNHIAEFKTVLKNFKTANYDIIHYGIHRLEAGKWIIVISEKEE